MSQTLSRLHVCATLAFAQVIGSICVMIARATAPNSVGPGSVFPDAAKWDFSDGLSGMLNLIRITESSLYISRRESNGPPSILDCFDLPANHCHWLFLVLPQRTVGYVVYLYLLLRANSNPTLFSATIST